MNRAGNAIPSIDSVAILFLVATALIVQITDTFVTGFKWPAADIIPLVQQLLGQPTPPSDFFTRASVEPNPRHVFAWIVVGVSKIFHGDIGEALLFMQTLIATFQVPLLYLLFSRYLTGWNILAISSRFALFLGCFLILVSPGLSKLIAVAWWPPLIPQATPQSFSLLLATFSGLLLSSLHLARFAFVPALLSSLVHPAVGLMSLGFVFIIAPTKFLKTLAGLKMALASVIGTLSISLLFRPNTDLSVGDFTYIYAWLAHAEHYIPSHFGTLTALPWYFPFSTVMILLMVLSFGCLRFPGEISFRSFASALAYGGAVLGQYLFVEIKPIKQIVMLGPSRFTAFGFWFLLFFFSALVGWLFPSVRSLTFPKVKAPYLLIPFIFLGAFWILLNKRDDRVFIQSPAQADALTWIRKQTAGDSVFAGYFGSALPIRLYANRAVFAGLGFPFSETYFSEYRSRSEALFGNYQEQRAAPGSWIGERMASVFHSLTPRNFADLSSQHRLDYVLLENKHANAFENFKPLFKNDELSIYQVRDFK